MEPREDFNPGSAPASDFRPDPDGRPGIAIHRDTGEPYSLGANHPFFAEETAKLTAIHSKGDRKPTPQPFTPTHTVNGVPAIMIEQKNGPAYYEVSEHGGRGKQLKHGGATIVELPKPELPERGEE